MSIICIWNEQKSIQPSAKSPLALYFNDVSPKLSKAELRYSLIHFWEPRNAAKCGMLFDVNSFLQIFTQAFGQLTNLFPTGHCDARVHLIKLFSMIPASTQTRVHLQPHQFLHYKKQRGLSSWWSPFNNMFHTQLSPLQSWPHVPTLTLTGLGSTYMKILKPTLDSGRPQW